MTHDIFISYSSAQSDAAQAVCHLLEQHDIKCWMAPRNLTGGAEYGDVIEDAIKYSRAVVVLCGSANTSLVPPVRSTCPPSITIISRHRR